VFGEHRIVIKMERRGEKSFINTINAEFAKNLEAWQESPRSEDYPLKLNTYLELVRSAGFGLNVKVREESLKNIDEIRILPEELRVLSVRHWPEGDLMVFQFDPIKDQSKKGKDPYIVSAYTNGDDYSSLTFYHMYHGDVAHFLPEDVSSIEIATQKVFATLRQVGEEIFPNRLPGILRGLPQG